MAGVARRWQIRTFWFGFLWISLCVLFIIATLGIGIVIAWLPMAVVALWFIDRIVRGWIALRDNRPMYVARVWNGGSLAAVARHVSAT